MNDRNGITDEEHYKLLPNYNEMFITTILSMNNSYTNQTGTDFGWFDFIYELVQDIIDDKVTKEDLRIKFITNDKSIGFDFGEMIEIIMNTYNEIHKDISLLKKMISDIDDANFEILKKHNLISPPEYTSRILMFVNMTL